MIKVYFRYRGKLDSLHMQYTENPLTIHTHVTTLFKNASVVRVFLLNNEVDND